MKQGNAKKIKKIMVVSWWVSGGYTYTHTHIYTYTHTIETYGLAPRAQPTNRNIWPHNSRATAAPSRLADSFVCFSTPSIPTTYTVIRSRFSAQSFVLCCGLHL